MVNVEFLREIVSIIQKGLGSDETFGAIFDLLEKSVPFDSATLYLYHQKADRLEIIHQKGEEIVDLAQEIPFDRGNGISSWVSKQKKPIILQSLVKSRSGKEHRFSSFVSMPLWVGDKLVGVLNIGHQEPDVYKRIEISDYEIISSQISIILDKIILQKQLREHNILLKEALSKLKRAQKQLIEKERLAAIGEVVITVNHEINNPLTSIIGLAEILELAFQTGKHEKVREGLRGILKEANRIRKVTHKLAEISSSESKKYVGKLRMIELTG